MEQFCSGETVANLEMAGYKNIWSTLGKVPKDDMKGGCKSVHNGFFKGRKCPAVKMGVFHQKVR